MGSDISLEENRPQRSNVLMIGKLIAIVIFAIATY
jgi:hypothetical protein